MKLTRRTFGALSIGAAAYSQTYGIEEVTVFGAGEEGYHTFRIPSLLVTAKGALLAFCEGRRLARGDSGAIDMIVKRSEDNGLTWSAPQIVWREGENTCGNACPVVDRRTGLIVLPMCWNRGDDHGQDLHSGKAKGTRRVYVTHSDDDGETWAPARDITKQAKADDWWWYATGPGVSIQIRNGEHAGRIVTPANHTSNKSGFAANVIYSDDAGESWKRSSVIAPACNESQAVELADGRLMMNMRSQSFTSEERTGYRSISYSADGGETWTSPVFDKHLGDPQVQASLIRYSWPEEPGGGKLLFSNPNPPISAKRGPRVRMTVRVSRDDGKTWPAARIMHLGPSAYSSLARLPGGQIGLLYEAGRENAYQSIRLAQTSMEWMELGRDG